MLTTASFLAAALLLNACGGKSTPPPPPQPPVEMPVQQPLITAPKYATALAEGLKASTSGETGCTFSWTIQGGQFKDGSQGVTGAEIEFSAGPEGVILLECKSTNAKGKGSLPTRYEIQIVAAPKIESFKAAKTPITAGGEARLTAVFSGGSGLVEGVGSVQSGVAFGTGPLMERREFQLTVTNDAGSKVTQRLSVDVIPSPGIFAFSAAKPILTAGQSTTLTAVFEGTGAIEGLGPVQSGVALPTGVLNESRHFILNVLNAAGDAVRRELKVDVVAPPVIDGFEVDKPILTKGKVAQLKAVFKNGRGEIKGLGVVQSSVQSGVPLSTGILLDSAAYQLVVTNAAGDFVARECAVKVVEAPHIQSFSVHKPTVTTGEGASLIAHFSGGKGSLEGLGPIFSEVAFVTAGLNAARSFTLNVTNDAGDITSRSVSVDVVLPPTIESFVATKSPVTQGTATHLTAHFSGGTGRINGTELVKSGVALPTGILSESKVFTLVVTNAAGAIAQKDLKIEVIDPPSIQSFSAIQSILTKGKATSLTAEFKGGKGHIENVGDIVSGGSLPSGPLDATRKFKLTVTNEAGTEIHQFAEIRVVDEPKIQSFTASASQITEGDPVTLSYQFSGGKATIQGLPGELISGGSSTVQPKESITYVLTVTNDAKDSVTEQRDVKVFAAPVIHAFSGGGLLNPGETTTLTAEFSGGKGVINQDIGPVESGFSIVTEPLSQGRIYTLTVTNDAGGSVRAHRVVAMPQTLAGGAFHSLQVMSDGTVRAWGSNTYGALGIKNHAAWGSPLAIPDLKGIRSVSADNNFSLALDEKGHVWSWGKNDVGQLGNGTTKNRSTPAPIPGLENVVALKASARHALFLTVDGKVWAVGTCDYLPDHINTRLPVCIQELDGVLSIAAGMENSFALKGDGSVWAWGYGPLGDGSGSSQGKPVQVKELSGIVALAAKGYCSMALKEDGTVWSWGNNAWGQLGYPAEAFSEVPAQIPELTGVVNIWAGCYSGLAQKSDDSLYFWGELGGSFGVDGLISKTPAPLPGLADFKCLGVGYSHCLALQSDGRLLSLGDNQAGQLGDGTVKPVMLPVPLEGLPKFKDVAGGGNFSLALDEEGNLWAWGDRPSKLGEESTFVSSAPIPVSGIGEIKAIVAGEKHALALNGEGSVWVWESQGPPVIVPIQKEIVAIAAGGGYSLALDHEGGVWAWGNNSEGALGDGSKKWRDIPTLIEGLEKVEAISAGKVRPLALKNGKVWSWGWELENGERQRPVELKGLEGIKSIAAGNNQYLAIDGNGNVLRWTEGSVEPEIQNLDGLPPMQSLTAWDHCLALTQTGEVWSWGRNNYGQLGLGHDEPTKVLLPVQGLKGIIKMGLGFNHSLALTENGQLMVWGIDYHGQLGLGRTFNALEPVEVLQ